MGPGTGDRNKFKWRNPNPGAPGRKSKIQNTKTRCDWVSQPWHLLRPQVSRTRRIDNHEVSKARNWNSEPRMTPMHVDERQFSNAEGVSLHSPGLPVFGLPWVTVPLIERTLKEFHLVG